MSNLRAFWYYSKNFGDCLSPIILEFLLGKKIIPAKRNATGKLLAVGSILRALRQNDIVWGSGAIVPVPIKVPSGVKFLAVRGPLTRKMTGDKAPEIYGDPAILMPLIYSRPIIEKTHELGIIPHYVDKNVARAEFEAMDDNKCKLIDIEANWKTVINEILSCAIIVSSSLHGIIVAESYGVPAVWTKYGDKIIGGDFKFQDYFLGTGRSKQEKNVILPPLENLKDRQDILIKALKDHYAK